MGTYADFMTDVARVLALTYNMNGMNFNWCWRDAYEHNCSAIEAVEIYEEQMTETEHNYKGY